MVEHLGSDTFVYADAAEAGTLIVRAGAETDIAPGASVKLKLDRSAIHRFDAGGTRMT